MTYDRQDMSGGETRQKQLLFGGPKTSDARTFFKSSVPQFVVKLLCSFHHAFVSCAFSRSVKRLRNLWVLGFALSQILPLYSTVQESNDA